MASAVYMKYIWSRAKMDDVTGIVDLPDGAIPIRVEFRQGRRRSDKPPSNYKPAIAYVYYLVPAEIKDPIVAQWVQEIKESFKKSEPKEPKSP